MCCLLCIRDEVIMRAAFGITAYVALISGLITTVVGIFSGSTATWVWGATIAAAGVFLVSIAKQLVLAERNMLATNAVRGIGPVPPRSVQKQLWQMSMHIAFREGYSEGFLPYFAELCQSWALENVDASPGMRTPGT